MLSRPVARATIAAAALLVFQLTEPLLFAILPSTTRPVPGQRVALGGGSEVFVRSAHNDNPLLPQTVTSFGLIVVNVLLLLCLLGAAWWAAPARAGRLAALSDAASCWCCALLLAQLLTDAIKSYCGVLRPNFYAGCGWTEAEGCRLDHPTFRHSFPSGHSSTSACSAHALALYLLALPAAAADDDARPPRAGWLESTELARPAAALASWAVALWVAASRVVDCWHSEVDVTAGVALGAACAAFSFGWHFSSSAAAARPYHGI